jgi:gamma-glutamyltranspeptidase
MKDKEAFDMSQHNHLWYEQEIQDLWSSRISPPQRLSISKEGMVAAQHYLATEAGSRILANGGNAIDAAVAAAFALGVCEPAASGLGGQTMMLIHLARIRGSNHDAHSFGSQAADICIRWFFPGTQPNFFGDLAKRGASSRLQSDYGSQYSGSFGLCSQTLWNNEA